MSVRKKINRNTDFLLEDTLADWYSKFGLIFMHWRGKMITFKLGSSLAHSSYGLQHKSNQNLTCIALRVIKTWVGIYFFLGTHEAI